MPSQTVRDLLASGLVTNQPYPEDQPDRCPDCGSTELTDHGGWSTLAGGPPGINHAMHDMSCSSGHAFQKETKWGERWFTRNGKLLMGVPGCYETCVWTCAKCGEDMEGYHTTPDGTRLGQDGKPYGIQLGVTRTFYCCRGCGVEVEVDKPEPKGIIPATEADEDDDDDDE